MLSLTKSLGTLTMRASLTVVLFFVCVTLLLNANLGVIQVVTYAYALVVIVVGSNFWSHMRGLSARDKCDLTKFLDFFLFVFQKIKKLSLLFSQYFFFDLLVRLDKGIKIQKLKVCFNLFLSFVNFFQNYLIFIFQIPISR